MVQVAIPKNTHSIRPSKQETLATHRGKKIWLTFSLPVLTDSSSVLFPAEVFTPASIKALVKAPAAAKKMIVLRTDHTPPTSPMTAGRGKSAGWKKKPFEINEHFLDAQYCIMSQWEFVVG